MQWKRSIWVALLLLAVTPAVRATSLPPGAVDVVPDSATLDNAVFVASTTVTYNVGGTTVVLTNQALRSTEAYVGLPAGTLVFTYQFTNTGSGAISPLVAISTLFGGLTLDVSSTDFAGFTRADRSVDGNTITMRNFATGSGAANILAPGETSPLIVIRTSIGGDPGLIGTTSLNGSTGSGPTFAPLAIVPEPTTLALAVVGLPLAGALGLRRWRRRQAGA